MEEPYDTSRSNNECINSQTTSVHLKLRETARFWAAGCPISGSIPELVLCSVVLIKAKSYKETPRRRHDMSHIGIMVIPVCINKNVQKVCESIRCEFLISKCTAITCCPHI